MNKISSALLRRVLLLNKRLAESTSIGIDWLFNRDTLIQSGRTWFELVHDGDLMAVRYYELPGETEIKMSDGTIVPIRRRKHAVPLVLVPPLGVTTETFDLLPERSLVRYMVAAGFKVYLIDWGKPGPQHAHLGLVEYSYDMMGLALSKIRKHSGSQDVSLMGWCMGGLLSLLYQGQAKDPYLRNIVTVASPIDLGTGSGVLGAVASVAQALDGPAKLLGSYSKLRLNTLDPALLSLPDWATTLAFKATDPVGSVTAYWDLVTRLWDREFVESHSTTADYLNNMRRYPGGVLKDMIKGAAIENLLAKGKMPIGEKIAELDSIESNLLAFAGESDYLVPLDAAEKIIDVVASKDASFRAAPGGHMGVIIGSTAPAVVWQQSADWLKKRSGVAKLIAEKQPYKGC